MTEPRDVVLIGGGEHARVVAEVLRQAAAPFTIRGYVDPVQQQVLEQRYGIPHLGGDEALAAHRDALAVLAFGALPGWTARGAAAARLEGQVAGWAVAIHRAAWVSPSAVLGPGTVVMPGAVVQAGAQVGRHGVLNSGCVVEHDCRVGTNVHVGPGATLGGGVSIGDDCYIGLGAAVRDHLRLGRGVVVALGAAVVSNLEDGAMVKGVPART